jgi:hypothetical protein
MMKNSRKTISGTGTAIGSEDLYFGITNLLSKCSGNYLEIGCYEGVGIAGVAEFCDEIAKAQNVENNKKVYGIDPFLGDEFVSWDDHVELRKNLKEGEEAPMFLPLTEQKENLYHNISPYDSITFYETTTEDFMKSKTDAEIEEMNISVCLVDGSHHYDYVVIDWQLALKAIGDKSGFIFFDDTHEPGVVNAIGDFLAYFEETSPSERKLGGIKIAHDFDEDGEAKRVPVYNVYYITDTQGNWPTQEMNDFQQDENFTMSTFMSVMCTVENNNKFQEYLKQQK